MGNLFSGMFGGPQQNGFNQGDINNEINHRQGQINDFSNSLSQMRSQYLSQIPQLNQAAFNQFGQNAAGSFGAHGMTAGGGAFQGALAREAVPMQANMYNTAYSSGVNNLNAVNSANAGLASGALGAYSAGLSAPTQNPFGAALGGLAGQAGMMYLGSKLFSPAGTPGAAGAAGLSPLMSGNNAMQGQTGGGDTDARNLYRADY